MSDPKKPFEEWIDLPRPRIDLDCVDRPTAFGVGSPTYERQLAERSAAIAKDIADREDVEKASPADIDNVARRKIAERFLRDNPGAAARLFGSMLGVVVPAKTISMLVEKFDPDLAAAIHGMNPLQQLSLLATSRHPVVSGVALGSLDRLMVEMANEVGRAMSEKRKAGE